MHLSNTLLKVFIVLVIFLFITVFVCLYKLNQSHDRRSSAESSSKEDQAKITAKLTADDVTILSRLDKLDVQRGVNISGKADTTDPRFTNSRTCNNTFDNAETSRINLDVFSKNEVNNSLAAKSNTLTVDDNLSVHSLRLNQFSVLPAGKSYTDIFRNIYWDNTPGKGFSSLAGGGGSRIVMGGGLDINPFIEFQVANATTTMATGGSFGMIESLHIHSTGNIGIRTTNPASELDVNGTVTCKGLVVASDFFTLHNELDIQDFGTANPLRVVLSTIVAQATTFTLTSTDNKIFTYNGPSRFCRAQGSIMLSTTGSVSLPVSIDVNMIQGTRALSAPMIFKMGFVLNAGTVHVDALNQFNDGDTFYFEINSGTSTVIKTQKSGCFITFTPMR